MTLLSLPTLGLEHIARQTLLILMESLNDEIEVQNDYWAPFDEELATLREVDYVPIVVEDVAPEHFYVGHRPSLIKAPIENYPNVSVMAYRATQAAGDSNDHIGVVRDSMFVELMVKGSTEDETNSRSQRFLDAVHICLLRNPTLNGLVSGIDTAPDAQVTDLFVRKENTAYGPEYFWQGARLDYALAKESVLSSIDQE